VQLTILGGSSPFAAELYVELGRCDLAKLPDSIVLYGRDREALNTMVAFASRCLGEVRVSGTTKIEEALDGADIVLHQIRYGGLEGRAEDEVFCRRAGVPADETLGPGGLRAAIRMRPGLEATCRAVTGKAPNAFVINLTNPLSLSTALMRQSGIGSVVGVCELPQATGHMLSELVGETLTWDYIGLNHRGFLFNLRRNDAPALETVLQRLPSGSFEGIAHETIVELGAVPTKYFRLFVDGDPFRTYGRASELAKIRSLVIGQLQSCPDEIPNALAKREQPWWQEAVVPLIGTVVAKSDGRQILNVPSSDGLVREGWVELSSGSQLRSLKPRASPPGVDRWLAAFEAHEIACLAVLKSPTMANLTKAYEADPLLDPDTLRRVVAEYPFSAQ
jgi:6-phospho-beta-glucosidase